MRKRTLLAVTATVAVVGASGGQALAAPPNTATDPFVCPVLTLPAASADNFNSLGDGQYTLAPGAAGSSDTFNGNVPNLATNADGSGSPGGSHSSPGNTDYTAIWSGNQ
jgi:ABC-type phosphate transport system substrate-binding protein